jgi:Schlafen, AlbA_2
MTSATEFDVLEHTLVDLRADPELVRALVEHGEDDHVERKRTVTAKTLAKAVGALANGEGGWVLLGVDDDEAAAKPTVPGFTAHGRAHVADWARDVLTGALQPLPHFRGDTFDYDGASVGVLRVPRSRSTPHFAADGAIWQRRNRQSVRLSADEAQPLYERGERGRQRALGRLNHPAAATTAAEHLGEPRESNVLHGLALVLVLRTAPVETTPRFHRLVHSREMGARSAAHVDAIGRALNDRGLYLRAHAPVPLIAGEGHYATADWDGFFFHAATVVHDGGGVSGVRLDAHKDGSHVTLDEERVRDCCLAMTVPYLLQELESCDITGEVAVKLTIRGVPGATVSVSGVGHGALPLDRNVIEIEEMIELPTDESHIDALVGAIWLKLARAAGVPLWS